MLKAVFYEACCEFHGFEISGHAGYGEAVNDKEGNDIVCAAVSSCTMLVCNAITESFKAKADVTVEKNRISLRLRGYNEASMRLLGAFYSHLESIAEDYSNVKLVIEDYKQR